MAAPWRYALEYRAVAAVAAAVRALPQWASVAIGAAIGTVFYVVDAPHRRLTVANLSAAFPHKAPSEIRSIARGVFAHFGSLLTELLRFSGLPPAKMLASVEFEGEERVTHALAGGKGALFITGHFGYWELHALAHALRFPPIGVVVRALDNPRLNAWIEALRTSTGNSVIHRRGALRQILRALG
jgi:KDO2-lipid IV(A) lauroyltransferase